VKNITGNWFISAKGYVMDVAYSTQWTRGDTWRRPKWSQSRPLDQMDVSKSVQITLKGRPDVPFGRLWLYFEPGTCVHR